MTLYHFTRSEKLQGKGTIRREGLLIPPKPEQRPGGPDVDEGMYAAGIWLTANPEPVPWWVGGGFGGAFYGIARIMVVIPTKDRRLKQCKAHLKKHARLLYETYQKESNEKDLKWEDWYFYFGNIKPSRFREIVEYLAEESP
jgi:hypothetical protein